MIFGIHHHTCLSTFRWKQGDLRARCYWYGIHDEILIRLKRPRRDISCTITERNDFEGDLDEFIAHKVGEVCELTEH